MLSLLLALVFSPPTFTHDVAPILYRNCVTCHHPGTNSVFSLLTYADVRPRARLIAAVTSRRYMPPWKPEHGYGPEFQNARGFTDQQIDTIRRWVDEGALECNNADLPAQPLFVVSFQLGHPDLTLPMPDQYELRAYRAHIFRNFVLPIPASTPRY